MKDKITWEELTETTSRAKIFGGWLVSCSKYKGHTCVTGTSNAVAVSLVFVPDPNHDWIIEKEE